MKTKKKKGMSIKSAKAKGRRLCNLIKERLYAWAPDLKPGDIEITSSGVNGEDLKLSPAAREIYPFSIEAKNQEKINVWKAFEQAQSNCGEYRPLLVIARNRTEPLAVLKLEDLLWLIR